MLGRVRSASVVGVGVRVRVRSGLASCVVE